MSNMIPEPVPDANVIRFRRKGRIPSYAPLLLVVLLVASSLLMLLLDFRIGALGLAASVGLAMLFRLVLSDEAAGLLVVRTRKIDVACLATMAGLLVILAVIVPQPPG